MPTFDRPDQPAGLVSRPALVMFSGGQDSTTCLFWALNTFSEVSAIAFDYGQRHVVELEQAHIIAEKAGVPLEVIDLAGLLSNSALTDASRDVNAPHEHDASLPGAFVPGRNALFITLAATHAYQRGIVDLVGGMCQADYSGYPDCRIGFVQAMQRAMGMALDVQLRIHVPLMYLSKAETWKLARDLGEVAGLNVLEVVRDLSHTDYHGDRTQHNEWGFGRLDNPASKIRARGYEEARKRGWL